MEYSTSVVIIFSIIAQLFLCCEGKYSNMNTKHDKHKSNANLVVNTIYGQVRGFYMNDTRAFYGIPFALPPIGNRRWMRPSEPKTWTPRVLDATIVPHACIQTKNNPEVSEDCLYLNVHTPIDTTPTSNLPVIVIIYGGVFRSHSAMTEKFDGRFLAAEGSVVVNFNYRLGALGFVATNSPDITGNYGIMDQRQALKVIQENIQSFGGNPKKVTIMGVSAGAQCVATHMTSDISAPLFSQAVLQDNPFSTPFRTKSEMASEVGKLFAEYLNCSATDVTCLKNRSATDILDAQVQTETFFITNFIENPTPGIDELFKDYEVWGPVIDGTEIDANPLESFRAGKYSRKPFIIGSNREDSRFYTQILGTDKISLGKYLAALLFFFEWDSVEIAAKYPPLPFGDNRDILTAVLTDYVAGCSSRLVGRLAVNNTIPVYHYLYSFPAPPSLPGVKELCIGYSCHSDEVIPAFGTFKLKDFTPSPEFKFCSDSMLYSWLNFAHTGDPGNHTWSKTKVSQTYWPKYESGTGWQSYEFTNSGNKIITDYRNSYCNFWDRLGYI